jgi:hypothetical protein
MRQRLKLTTMASQVFMNECSTIGKGRRPDLFGRLMTLGSAVNAILASVE